jgi:haloalkane dehalogenase
VEVLRTPDERFHGLAGYGFEPHHVEVDGVRIHFVDEGPRAGEPLLLLHGEPSWSFLYRRMIPPLAAAGLRVVAPDLVGFGRSDKPARREDYTYARHVAWTAAVLDTLGLDGITLFGQDWGGLIGLRLVGEQPNRFRRVCASNTSLPTGDQRLPGAFFRWRELSQTVPDLALAAIVAAGCRRQLEPEEIDAYDAPFPDERFKAGARQFPMLVPTSPADPAAEANRGAWRELERFEKPFLTVFGDSDPITRGAERMLQERIPGCRAQPHRILEGAGHFIQEDAPDELVTILLQWTAAG